MSDVHLSVREIHTYSLRQDYATRGTSAESDMHSSPVDKGTLHVYVFGRLLSP